MVFQDSPEYITTKQKSTLKKKCQDEEDNIKGKLKQSNSHWYDWIFQFSVVNWNIYTQYIGMKKEPLLSIII